MQTFEQIMSDLKKRQFKPVYFLMGEEPYFIDAITDYIEKNLLRDDEKAFNQTVVYGADVDLGQMINMSTVPQKAMLTRLRCMLRIPPNRQC